MLPFEILKYFKSRMLIMLLTWRNSEHGILYEKSSTCLAEYRALNRSAFQEVSFCGFGRDLSRIFSMTFVIGAVWFSVDSVCTMFICTAIPFLLSSFISALSLRVWEEKCMLDGSVKFIPRTLCRVLVLSKEAVQAFEFGDHWFDSVAGISLDNPLPSPSLYSLTIWLLNEKCLERDIRKHFPFTHTFSQYQNSGNPLLDFVVIVYICTINALPDNLCGD